MPGIEGALHWCAPGPDRSNGNLVYRSDPIASLIITTAKGLKKSQLLTIFSTRVLTRKIEIFADFMEIKCTNRTQLHH